jgi:ectoine hydroxylase-related dioxygenase (phytanoyl-CoA dioxygenase family)
MVEDFLSTVEIDELADSLDAYANTHKGRGGVRNLLDHPKIRGLANSAAVRSVVESVLGPDALAVRGILFDKTEGANWKVPWHQDVTIAVKERIETSGYGPWSVKSAVLHVQPPPSVLEKMISLRVHLDDCPGENGALRVIPGSHRAGKLDERVVQWTAEKSVPVVCAMKRRGLLLMRPLLIHASSASTVPGRRRVIHLDYAATVLPDGMGWATAQA